jgi:hypothetical protein
MKEINVDLGKFETHAEQLTLIKNDPEGQKDVWLEIFGLSAEDGFTVEIGIYKDASGQFHYWEICHKGRVFIHLIPWERTDDYVLSEMRVYIGANMVDWYGDNNVFDLQIFIFDNNLLVAYVHGSTMSDGFNNGMVIIPPNDAALEFGQIRYDMYSAGIASGNETGVLGALNFRGGIDTVSTALTETLYEYFQDAVMASPNTPSRKTRDNGTLVLRDFSLCGSDFMPHVVENMWMICSMPTALLTQRFIKLNGTKHMIIRSKKDSEQSWFLLANTGEEYTGSTKENSW